MRIDAAIKLTSTCLIQLNSVLMIGERWTHRSVHVESNSNTFINSSNGIPYSRVCGRIIACRFGTPDAFSGYRIQNQHTTLDDAYVDGVSITYWQNPRHHIWTFAASRGTINFICPRTTNSFTAVAPPFIDGDHFCELLTPILTQALLSTTHYGMAMAVLALVPAVNLTTICIHGQVLSTASSAYYRGH